MNDSQKTMLGMLRSIIKDPSKYCAADLLCTWALFKFYADPTPTLEDDIHLKNYQRLVEATLPKLKNDELSLENLRLDLQIVDERTYVDEYDNDRMFCYLEIALSSIEAAHNGFLELDKVLEILPAPFRSITPADYFAISHCDTLAEANAILNAA